MANTIMQRTLVGGGSDDNIYRLIHIISDGSEETDLVIYDNSTLTNNVAKGSLKQVWLAGSDALVRLEWDQTTDAPIFSGNPINSPYFDFRAFGGITNPNGAGATGDILLTTANLDIGDEVVIILHIFQN